MELANQHKPQEVPVKSVKIWVLFTKSDNSIVGTLEAGKLRPRDIGIRYVVEFASGMALILVEVNKSEEFHSFLPNLGLRLKPKPTPRKLSFRLHNTLPNSSREEIKDDITAFTGIKPEVTILKGTEGAKTRGNLAMMSCDRELFEAV